MGLSVWIVKDVFFLFFFLIRHRCKRFKENGKAYHDLFIVTYRISLILTTLKKLTIELKVLNKRNCWNILFDLS